MVISYDEDLWKGVEFRFFPLFKIEVAQNCILDGAKSNTVGYQLVLISEGEKDGDIYFSSSDFAFRIFDGFPI